MPTLEENGTHRKSPQIRPGGPAKLTRFTALVEWLAGLRSEKSMQEVEREVRQRRREKAAARAFPVKPKDKP